MTEPSRPTEPSGSSPPAGWLSRALGQTASEDAGGRRVLWIGRVCVIAATVLMLALLVRVGQLQVDPPERIGQLLDSQSSERQMLGRRGSLLDRRGRTLASTRVARRLFIDPALIVNRNTFSEHVAYALDYNPAEIERRLFERRHSRYIVVDRRLSDQRWQAARELELPGLATEPVLVRDYPKGALAGHLIGFTNVDGEGLAGLERLFDGRLSPAMGRLRYLRDARRRPIWVEAEGYQAHRDGQDVRLSIDLVLQQMAEAKLAETVAEFGARSGQIVMMDPHTGQILAMANHPPFDPNRFSEAEADARRNRAVTDVFEPGSIFKPFVWAALTEAGAADPEELIDTTESGVYYTSRGRRLRDANPNGLLTWKQVLSRSSNIGMAKVAQRVGIERLHGIVRRFGFGQRTGSNLPGEVAGLVNPLANWNHYSETSIPMGQEIGVTALQMMRAFASVANGGLLMTPTIELSGERALIQDRVMEPSVAELTRQVLREAVAEGTGRHAQSDRYRLFGKTGTAQLPDFEAGGYKAGAYISSFVAGAPLDSPQIIVGCFIHEPDTSVGYYGGLVAAPPVRDLIDEALAYMGVGPDLEAEISDF